MTTLLNAYLDPGERLLWSGAPVAAIKFTPRDILSSLFSLFLLGFALFWIGGAGTGLWTGEWRGESGFQRWMMFLFPLFGVPFVLVSAYYAFGRFPLDARRRARTRLGLTDRRALIWVDGRAPVLTSFPLTPEAVVEFFPARYARIHFATMAEKDSEGWTSYHRAGFDWIAEGETVYRLIRKIQTGAA